MNDSLQIGTVLEHNKKAAAMWSGPGRAYDEVSRGIADAIEHCVERLMPAPGERVLDVATGTGWTSRRVAARGADVTGIDIAEGLLESARELAAEANLAIDYRVGDAERLPFEDNSFDAIVSTFGVMFAADQEAAIQEVVRVCRPGGRLSVAAWLPDSAAVTMRQVMAPFMPAAPTPATPPPSPFNWGDPEWLKTAFGGDFDLGFEEGVTYVRYPDGDALWRAYGRGFGPVKALADSLDSAKKQELRAAFGDWANRYTSDLGLAVPIQYLVTLGRRQ